jgi:excinuclease ABC subunit A
LVDTGNTVLVIEHNLDVIKSADWIVDLGPEGGAGGGAIVAEGTPESVAKVPESHTGRFLAKVLDLPAPKPKPSAAKPTTKVSAANNGALKTGAVKTGAAKRTAAKPAPRKPAKARASAK